MRGRPEKTFTSISLRPPKAPWAAAASTAAGPRDWAAALAPAIIAAAAVVAL